MGRVEELSLQALNGSVNFPPSQVGEVRGYLAERQHCRYCRFKLASCGDGEARKFFLTVEDRVKQHNESSSDSSGYGCSEEFVCVIGCRQGLTSSTRPKPPTPSVAMTSSWSKGLEEGNGATSSFSRMTSGDSGWLWWRDTDLFLDNDGDTDPPKKKASHMYFSISQQRNIKTWTSVFIRSAVATWRVSFCRPGQESPRNLVGASAAR